MCELIYAIFIVMSLLSSIKHESFRQLVEFHSSSLRKLSCWSVVHKHLGAIHYTETYFPADARLLTTARVRTGREPML